jgi:hypothetical protein
MVLQSLLERIFLPKAKKYITGYDSKKLKVGIWSGNVVLENIGLSNFIMERL